MEKHIDNLIKQELKKLSPYSEFTDNTDIIKDCGLDSLDIVEIYMNIEKELDIHVSDEEISNCGTKIKDIKAMIMNHLNRE